MFEGRGAQGQGDQEGRSQVIGFAAENGEDESQAIDDGEKTPGLAVFCEGEDQAAGQQSQADGGQVEQ